MNPDLGLAYRVHVPKPDWPRPVAAAVMVHGWLGDERAMSVFERTLPPGVLAISPRAPFEMDSGYGWYRRRTGDELFHQGLAALRDFIGRLPEAFSVDPARMVLMGFSQGAAMCAALALSEPGRVAGLAMLAGFLPEQADAWIAPKRVHGLPVFMAHGARDEMVPLAQALAARDALRRAGADVEYHEHALGHKLAAPAMRALAAWLKATLPAT